MAALYFDREGNEISLERFTSLFGEESYRIIKWTEVGSHLISTIWLGVSHGASPCGPLIFETIVFENDKEMELYRYSTEEQAIRNHDVIASTYVDLRQVEKNYIQAKRWLDIIKDTE